MSSLVNNQMIEEIRNLLINSRTQLQQSVNSIMVRTYWNIGRIIVEDEQNGEQRATYGKKQLEQISNTLSKEFGKGFDTTNLRNMRRLYLTFPIQETLSLKLSWSHYCKIMRIENKDARDWYIKESIENNWSVRVLSRQISKLYYERLLSSSDKKSLVNEANEKINELQTTDIKNYLRDPYVFDFLNLPNESLLETNIEQALIDNLQQFLLELGRGFAFVSRQKRLSVEEQDFYIDLVFYNFKLKCFLLIDLKLGKLTHQDVGQMDTYVRVYDKFEKAEDDNPTIGLILCSEPSLAVAKYSVLSESKQLFSSKYLPFLPTEEELQKELLRERNLLFKGSEDE
ncbi:YhcG family protein [Malaciobacter canalis]|uniref:PDDEXK nuclease domain-containing protein n=1 Tax=Malaciobacter canalis TaxID=1912871 RepID=UPI00384D2D0F